MGGKEASRGFLYQGFASILEASTDEGGWDKIYVEYPTTYDKVDIALEERGRIIKCIQVKSTINIFTKSNIQKWINDLIRDYDSPEYKLILIGQCNTTANTFIKSIGKYYENAFDKEVRASLTKYDMGLLADKRICFSILPYDICILKQIVRDSLHKYISRNNYRMLFDQIAFIALAMLEDQMISSTHGKGIDRKEFDEKLKEGILLTADKYFSQRTSIAVVSYDRDTENLELEKEVQTYCSFIAQFNGRELKNEYSWNDDIYKRLVEFLHQNTNNKGIYQLFLINTHASIAFAAGRILNSKSGINIFPVQKTTGNGIMLWDVKYDEGTDDCDWKVEEEQLRADQFDSALILNVTRNIKNDVIKFIKDSNLPIGRFISCIPRKMGATNISIKDGTHASLLANNVYNAIVGRSFMERRAMMHIFAAAPNAFMCFLGQNSLGFGKCILYEYDFEQRNSCTYLQSINFID